MLFHVTHTHAAESCPAHDPKLVEKTWGKTLAGAKETGVKLIGAYVDSPGHTFYMTIESDSAESIRNFLQPVLTVGYAEITPVTDALETVKKLS